MHSYFAVFAIAAPAREIWQVLHPPAPRNATSPRVIEYPCGSVEIPNQGDEAGQGLVRTCVSCVRRHLISGGTARSREVVNEAKINKPSRYVTISKPLWSRAEGYHELNEQPDATTLLTFRETDHAFSPLLRALFEGRVHATISNDNTAIYEHALGYAGTTKRVS